MPMRGITHTDAWAHSATALPAALARGRRTRRSRVRRGLLSPVRHPTGHGEEHWRRGHLVSRGAERVHGEGVYRAAFAAHPRVVPLLTTAPVRAPEIIAAHEEMVGLLEEVGVPVDQAMACLTACENFVIGSALDSAAPDVMWEIPPDLDAPRLRSALVAQANPEHRANNSFEFGLTTLLSTLVRPGS